MSAVASAPPGATATATALSTLGSARCSCALRNCGRAATSYFWSVANGYRQNEPEATEQLSQEIAPTFVEDRVMVEAQQARLGEFGEAGLVDIASDATRMQMRRMVERLLARERAELAAE